MKHHAKNPKVLLKHLLSKELLLPRSTNFSRVSRVAWGHDTCFSKTLQQSLEKWSSNAHNWSPYCESLLTRSRSCLAKQFPQVFKQISFDLLLAMTAGKSSCIVVPLWTSRCQDRSQIWLRYVSSDACVNSTKVSRFQLAIIEFLEGQ